jgi:uncharacterized damage-inducible protein DinB
MQEPSWKELLTESFVYDHYANSAWLDLGVEQGNEEEKRVFGHILSASEIWVTRLTGVSLPKMPVVPFTMDSLDSLRDRWLVQIDRLGFHDEITFTNTLGDTYTRTFGDIARHAANHGTYHRGQIRESFGARGLDFPDTDFMGFTFGRDGLI